MNWKIVVKIPPNSPASDPVGSSASLLWGVPVKVKPCQIRDVKGPVVVYNQYRNDSNAHLCCEKGKSLVELGSVRTSSLYLTVTEPGYR
jgi:hypothetical protein